MNVVIDASVFIAAVRDEEIEHLVSRRAINQIVSTNHIYCPVIVLTECSGALARVTGDVSVPQAVVIQISQLPQIHLAPISLQLANRSAEIAAACRLKGGDAVYVGLAEEHAATLVTLDKEMRQRGAAIVNALTPSEWLSSIPADES